MKTSRLLIVMFVCALPLSALAGLQRIEVSPATLVSLNEGRSGEFMGGAVTTDLYFTQNFALRTTMGLTKDRYWPSTVDYSESDYGFWVSFAPYAEMNIRNTISPYVSVLGSITSSGAIQYNRTPIGMEDAPVARLQDDYRYGSTTFSFGLNLGTKVRLSNHLAIFGELTHYFYSSINDDEVFLAPGSPLSGREFDFERNPTYLSFGLSYGFTLSKDRD